MNINTFKEQILFSTLRIQPTDNNKNPLSVGTGFFVKADLDSKRGKSIVLLISNKHVFEGSNSFVVNFHKKSIDGSPVLGSILRCEVSDRAPIYYPHPVDEIDLACVNFSLVFENLHSEIYWRNLELDFFADFTEDYLDIGQRIYFVGYPDGRYDVANKLPILRNGYIASHPLTDYNGQKQFLIDAHVFQGSSGSPVFINLRDVIYIDGKAIDNPGTYSNMFLGVLTHTMVRENMVVSAREADEQDKQYVQENIGIGLVYKSTAVLELIRFTLAQVEKNI